ncbi:MAG: transglycosylase SLT domain-containing protein [Treponema sp.]|nr:transglycosylase SLT domain-containing protein [Treponema sp.]
MQKKILFSILVLTTIFINVTIAQDITKEPEINTNNLELLPSHELSIPETAEPSESILASSNSNIQRKELEIWGADHPLSVKFREQSLTERNKKWIIQALNRSIPYRPYIQQRLQELNLPSILQYLPIVESYYNVNAVSSAGATGMWQFMTNSMAPLLKKNTWYDDRKDPWKSTDAALAKLSENLKQFKDWPLAIAAYNCGSGAMSRAVRKNPGKDFWYLAEHNILKSQSSQYVPKLLAIADVIENAEYYGVPEIAEAANAIKDKKIEEYDFLTTNGMYSFAQIAELAGIEESVIKVLNPALLRNCTPARIEYKLRLPFGTTEGLAQKLKDAGAPRDAIVYTVVEGDTLWGISRRYKLTVEDLCVVNNIREKDILHLKQKLIIPIFN